MAYLTIVARMGHPDLSTAINDKLSLHIDISQESQGEWQVLRVSHKDTTLTEEQEVILRAALMEVLEEYILLALKEPLIQEMVHRHYYYFSRQERDKVLYYSSLRDSGAGRKARQQVKEKLRRYLVNSRHLNIPGLVRFRLQEYLAELRKTVEGAVDDFLIEKEYQEFIKLLKYFVEIQEPKVREAHVFLDQSGRFQIRDGKHQVVEQNMDEINAAFLRDTVDSEDMLVSALVTAAPGRVVLHRQVDARHPKLCGTLRKIFDTRISLCKNCLECSSLARVSHKDT